MQVGAASETCDPLASFRLFESNDLDEARNFVSRTFCPHRLMISSRGQMLRTVHNHAAGRTLSLNFLRYGAGVEIEPGELSSFYLVQIPLEGGAEIRSGRHDVSAVGLTASILNPTLYTRMRWSDDCAKLLVQIDRAALHAHAERLAGQTLPMPVVFMPAIDLASQALRRWIELVRGACVAAETSRAFRANETLDQALLEERLIEALLLGQPSNVSALLSMPTAAACPRQIKRACEYIHDHFSEPLTVASIAAAAGCSVRSLQLGFRTCFERTPIAYLHERRLAAADYILRSARAGVTVGQVAEDVGLGHFGRFAQSYRRRFYVSPSRILREHQADLSAGEGRDSLIVKRDGSLTGRGRLGFDVNKTA